MLGSAPLNTGLLATQLMDTQCSALHVTEGLGLWTQAGRELGLAGETLHDAAQLLDRAGCLGLLPPLRPAPPSPDSDGAAVDGDCGRGGAPDVALVGAALLIACKSRALLA